MLAVLVGVAVPIDAARASTPLEETPAVTIDDAPALPSTDEQGGQPELPQGSFDIPAPVDAAEEPSQPLAPVSPPEPAAAVGEWERRTVPTAGLEVVGESESSTQYRGPSGANVTHLSTGPTHARNDAGEWVDAKTALSRRGDKWIVSDHPLAPVFRGGSEEAPAVTVSRNGHDVSFSLVGAEPGDVAAPFWWWDDWEQLTYRDVTGSADLEYRVEAGGVKESLVLDAVPDRRTSWTWSIDAGSLTPSLAEADSVVFTDESGTEVLMIPTPIATDSSGVEGETGDAEVALKVGLWKAADGSWRYTVRASREWLRDPARVYPVRIDPTVKTPSDATAYKSDGTTWRGAQMIGNTRENNRDRFWRSVVTYDYGSLPGQFIAGANLALAYDGQGTTSRQQGWVQHASGFSYNGAGSHLGYVDLATDWAEVQGDGVAARLAGTLRTGDRPAFMLGGWEGSSYSMKRVQSALWVESWDYPSVGGWGPADGERGSRSRPPWGSTRPTRATVPSSTPSSWRPTPA